MVSILVNEGTLASGMPWVPVTKMAPFEELAQGGLSFDPVGQVSRVLKERAIGNLVRGPFQRDELLGDGLVDEVGGELGGGKLLLADQPFSILADEVIAVDRE